IGRRMLAEIVGQSVGLDQQCRKAMSEPSVLHKLRGDLIADDAIEHVDDTARVSACRGLRPKRLPTSLHVLGAFHIRHRQLIWRERNAMRSRGADRARAQQSTRPRATYKRTTAIRTATSRATCWPNESTSP